MAKINSGILGGFSGQLNSVVGYRRNGKNIITGIRKYKSLTLASGFVDNYKRAQQVDIILNRYSRGILSCLNSANMSNKLTREEILMKNRHVINWSNPTYFFNMQLTNEDELFVGAFSTVFVPSLRRIGNQFTKCAQVFINNPVINRFGFVQSNQNGTLTGGSIAGPVSGYSTNDLYPVPNSSNYLIRGVRIFSTTANNAGVIRVSGAGLTW